MDYAETVVLRRNCWSVQKKSWITQKLLECAEKELGYAGIVGVYRKKSWITQK